MGNDFLHIGVRHGAGTQMAVISCLRNMNFQAKDDDHEASIGELVGLTKPQKVVAIGECGLDYYYEEAPYDAQLERFARHIEAAKLANLPVIVHSRDAQDDTIRLLKEHDAGSTGFVLHCFTGDKKMAQDALDLGGYLSFSGIVTFKNATQIQECQLKGL